MLYIMWAFVILFAIAFIIYHSHIKTDITYKRSKDNDIIILVISMFFGIIKYKLELPFLDFTKKIDSFAVRFRIRLKSGKEIRDRLAIKRAESLDEFMDNIQGLIDSYHANEKNIAFLMHKINIRNLRLDMNFGFEDAYLTGISYGVLNAAIGCLLAFLTGLMNIMVESINLKPVFNKDVFDLELNCIIDIKIGHIITALKKFLKTSRGSEIDGATYRKSYENNYGKY